MSAWVQKHAAVPLFAYVRFGRWEEILREPEPAEDLLLVRGMWHYARGLAYNAREELDKASGRHFTINATAALGALLCEIDFPVAAMRGAATVSRAAGLVAHVMEEAEEPITPALMDFAGKVDYADPE